MKRLVLLAALMIGSVHIYAEIPSCYPFQDNEPFTLDNNMNGCVQMMYSMCWQCAYSSGRSCASSRPCNPDGNGITPPRFSLASAAPQHGTPMQLHRTVSRTSSSPKQARVAKLELGTLF